MTDMIVREYRPEDIPALSALWARVFGDSVALIGDFFRLLPDHQLLYCTWTLPPISLKPDCSHSDFTFTYT